jgi:hypothetical protein
VLETAERETNSANGGLDHTKLVRCWGKDCIDWLISKQDMFSRKHTTDAGILDINNNSCNTRINNVRGWVREELVISETGLNKYTVHVHCTYFLIGWSIATKGLLHSEQREFH